MRRRDLIGLFGGATVIWPLAARAQQASKLPTIGFLGANTASVDGPRVTAFTHRLDELGWRGDRNVTIEFRWAEARPERAREIAAEFVRLKVDVIVTAGTTNVLAAKQATASIAIVFAAAGDPVGAGLVANLARPGGNVTGMSIEQSDTASKRLELLRKVVPALRRLSILGDFTSPAATVEVNEARAAARVLAIEATTTELRHAEDIAPAIASLKDRTDALYVVSSPFVTTYETGINAAALTAGLPTMHGLTENAVAGGLMSYGVDIPGLYRRAAEFVDKILRGAKPADIPVEQPNAFKFVINMKTARSLGLEVPYSMQLLADEVIE